jgi:hypothetical protein
MFPTSRHIDMCLKDDELTVHYEEFYQYHNEHNKGYIKLKLIPHPEFFDDPLLMVI